MNKKKTRDSPHPGRQKKTFKASIFPRSLAPVFTLILVLLLRSLVLDNVSHGYLSPHWLWKYQILDSKTLALLTVGLLSVFLIHRTYALSLLPFLNYKCNWAKYSELGLPDVDDDVYWFVTLENIGRGIAIISSASYDVSFHTGSSLENASYSSLIQFFHEGGIMLGEDYEVFNISKGCAIGPDKERPVLEIISKAALELKALDVHITFENMAGEKYNKSIYCIPRDGLPRKFEYPPKRR